ncbi:MAG: hypothetical protein CSH36_00485 [Thalassolituus sp.]|nr:MAG: hypothetical protein CSH36_00485 [Thalassolituus sp.]
MRILRSFALQLRIIRLVKWIAVALGCLLVFTNGFWLYSAIDLVATQKHRQQVRYEAENRTEALVSLCNKLVSGMPKSEAEALLDSLSSDFGIFEKEGRLHTVWLSFKLDETGHVAKEGACE